VYICVFASDFDVIFGIEGGYEFIDAIELGCDGVQVLDLGVYECEFLLGWYSVNDFGVLVDGFFDGRN
jgi:hypothetical protein